MGELTDAEKLNLAIDELINSKFIIAERAIQKLLSLVAVTPRLYSIIEEGAKTLSYATLFEEAVGNIDEFRLPKSKRQIVTLVTGLLYEFDDKKLPIVEFITHFFPAETGNEAFGEFCNQVMLPYKEAFNHILDDKPDMVIKDDFDVSMVPIAGSAKEEAMFWLNNLLDTTYGDNSLTPELRNDYIILIKGLMYVLELENSVLIRIIWTGIKNTIWYYRKGLKEIKELEAVLKSYGVID